MRNQPFFLVLRRNRSPVFSESCGTSMTHTHIFDPPSRTGFLPRPLARHSHRHVRGPFDVLCPWICQSGGYRNGATWTRQRGKSSSGRDGDSIIAAARCRCCPRRGRGRGRARHGAGRDSDALHRTGRQPCQRWDETGRGDCGSRSRYTLCFLLAMVPCVPLLCVSAFDIGQCWWCLMHVQQVV